ncbi:MAG TPA: bifunctional DNA primase/polymerase [Micromonosporaceae bacterium]
MLDLLTAALGYAERGWHVFPLRPGDKRPAFPNHAAVDCTGSDPRCRAAGRHLGWEERATTCPDRIRRAWSTRPYGIGIACGPSNLVVVDLDTPKPGQTPPPGYDPHTDGMTVFTDLCHRHSQQIDPTYTVTTGRGGTHLYYQHPDSGPKLRNTAGALGWLVDTRAHGGYVVAAANTIAGRPYTVTLDCDPTPLPGWLAGLLTPTRPPAQARSVPVTLPADRHGRYIAAAIRRQLAHLTAAAEGTRNHALFTSAVALGQLAAGGALTEADVYAVLEPAALSIGLRPGEITRTIASGLRTGARNPRHLHNVGRAAA